MATKQIGADGTFPLGGPINAIDRGGLRAAFQVSRELRLGVMQFGTEVSWLAAPPSEMRQLAQQMRKRCIEEFGHLPYDKSTLPIRVIANREKGVVELTLPQSAATLAANPELWLALAEVIDTTIETMKQ